MKLKRLAVIAIMVVAALALGGCFQLPIDDIDDPADSVAPVLTNPVAAFSYSRTTNPIQTGSKVLFDGSDSYDPDDEIMRGKWDFDDPTSAKPTSEGVWATMEKQWQNGEGVWVWEENVAMQEVTHRFNAIGLYTVTLTVWEDRKSVV